MDYTFEFTGDRVVITTAGEVDVVDVERLVHEMVSDPRFSPGLPILADHTKLQAGSLTSAETRQIGLIFVDLGARIGRSPLAIVVRDAVTYGLVRMAATYAAAAPLKPAFFFSRSEAETWLGEQAHQTRDAGH
jgi:hypothetical protein